MNELNLVCNNENVIEFYNNANIITCTFSQGRYKSKIKKLAEEYPNEVNYIENKDGTIVAHIPINYLKISHPKVLSEEAREKLSERAKENLGKNKNK